MVEVNAVGSNLILVSWLPPDPSNGILTSYLLLVQTQLGMAEVFSNNIPVGVAQQMTPQTVTVSGLDLENVGYNVFVFANTSVGMGPSSGPIQIGAEVGTPAETTADVTEEGGTMSQATTSQATPTLGSENISRDPAYYVIRIVPPVVAAFLLVAVVLIIVFCCLYRRAVLNSSKGHYQVQDSIQNQYR
jgi:hypothetical protein